MEGKQIEFLLTSIKASFCCSKNSTKPTTTQPKLNKHLKLINWQQRKLKTTTRSLNSAQKLFVRPRTCLLICRRSSSKTLPRDFDHQCLKWVVDQPTSSLRTRWNPLRIQWIGERRGLWRQWKIKDSSATAAGHSQPFPLLKLIIVWSLERTFRSASSNWSTATPTTLLAITVAMGEIKEQLFHTWHSLESKASKLIRTKKIFHMNRFILAARTHQTESWRLKVFIEWDRRTKKPWNGLFFGSARLLALFVARNLLTCTIEMAFMTTLNVPGINEPQANCDSAG